MQAALGGALPAGLLSVVAQSGQTQRALGEASIVRTVHVFCRIYQHNMAFSKRAESLLARSEWTQLEQLYALLN